MIVYIWGWDEDLPIYRSDVDPYQDYIGYQKTDGTIVMY